MTVLLAAALAGCDGITECGDDGAACAELINTRAQACAAAWQLKSIDRKRKNCLAAIKTIKTQNVKAAVPGLMAILSTPESGVPGDRHREEAAKALGRLGDAAAVAPLLAAIDLSAGTSSDPRDTQANRSNEQIVTALGHLKAKAAVPKLLEVVDRSADDHVVLKAVRALGAIGDAQAVDRLSKIALQHDDKFMRKTAIIALGNIGDPGATDALIQMMFVEYRGVSFYREASFALFQVGPAVAPALLETMALKNEKVNEYFEKSGGIQASVIQAKCGFVLGDLRDQRAVVPLIEAFKAAAKRNDAIVLAYATTPLAVLGDKRAVALLTQQMTTLDASLRDPMMRALVQLGAVEAVGKMMVTIPKAHFVEACIKTGAGKEACTSEQTQASLHGAQKASIDHVTNLATDAHLNALNKILVAMKDPIIKDYFSKRLKRVEVAAECKNDPACWAQKLDDKEPLIRERAAWTLARLRDKSAAPALIKALGDKNDKVRSAAIHAYWALGDKSAVPAIEKILEDDRSALDYVKVNEDLKRLLLSLKRA
ncbi:MAG: HEAT repeat domain-containing protein [Myxococcota bacterium]